MPVRDWPGRPTRAAVLAPRGIREKLAARLGRSLLTRWEHELAAETLRADAGWETVVETRKSLRALDLPDLSLSLHRDRAD